jgi:hypothetical protein
MTTSAKAKGTISTIKCIISVVHHLKEVLAKYGTMSAFLQKIQ